MARLFSTLVEFARSVGLLHRPRRRRSEHERARDDLDASVYALTRAIDRSLCLARAAGSARTRESYLGIARLNYSALRKLTRNFMHGATPECRRLEQAFDERDPWSFGVMSFDAPAAD